MKRSDSSLVYVTSSLGELMLTAIPKQLTNDPIFWLQNRSCSHSLKQSVTSSCNLTMTHLQSGSKQISVILCTPRKAWFRT